LGSPYGTGCRHVTRV